MLRKTFFIAVILLIAIAGVLSAQIKFPVTDDGTPLTYGKVVSVDGTNPNQVVAADGTDRTTDVVGVVVAVQGTDYLVITSGYLELSGASFTPGDRLTVNATGDIVTSANDEDILIGYAISATRVQILIDDDQARFTYFDDSFSGIGADNVQDAIDSLVDMIGDITSEDITFEGVVTFDSTVIFNDDTVYFGGPVIFDSTVVFNGPVDAETIYVGWLIGTQNDTIYFEQYLAGPEVVIDSIEAFGDGPIVIKDSTEFREKVTFESEIIVEGDLTVQGAATFDSTVYIAEGLEVDGDATFHDNVYVDDSLFAGYIDVDQMVVNDTLFANIIDADSAFFNYVETGDLVVNDSAYFGGPSVFGDDVTIEGDLTVEGDGYFEQNVYVTDTLFAGVIEAGNINADSIFSEYTETEVLVVTDSAYFGGPAYFDTTVVFGDDSVYFGGPVVFDSTVVFNGDVVLDQNIVQASRSAVLEFDTTPTEAIALTFTTSGDVIKLMATVIVSDEYSTTPNYNGAKITVELYDVTNTTVLKSYTVFLQDKDWYEIKEVSITHVMSAPAADNDYSVRCFADGWGNGGRIIEGDLTVTAIQQ